jgi:hypothetical protein
MAAFGSWRGTASGDQFRSSGATPYAPAVPQDLPFATRLWLSWACFFRVLTDGAFAASVSRLALPAPEPAPPPVAVATPEPRADTALQLLALLQREGRFIDFLEQDVAAFTDGDVGAAARLVHDGCRKALRAHAKLAPVRAEEEGARVTVDAGFAPEEIKLTGNVAGNAPYTGVLRHRGWRATDLTLPSAVRAYDASVLAPAEVELS